VSTELQVDVPPILRLALSPDEAAEALGVSRDFLDEHIGPELRWIRRGRRKLVAIAELERWLAESSARTLEGR
jgi:excisionase family DNA binding protein